VFIPDGFWPRGILPDLGVSYMYYYDWSVNLIIAWLSISFHTCHIYGTFFKKHTRQKYISWWFCVYSWRFLAERNFAWFGSVLYVLLRLISESNHRVIINKLSHMPHIRYFFEEAHTSHVPSKKPAPACIIILVCSFVQ
jgi:hypothetical protein